MPDHVHTLVQFGEKGQLSIFMNQWNRLSSMHLKKLYSECFPSYGKAIDLFGRMWQPKYYCFNVYSKAKLREKLDYMHHNPVRRGLVQQSQDWLYSSARWYFLNKPVGVTICPSV